jgi:hypothetical protein
VTYEELVPKYEQLHPNSRMPARLEHDLSYAAYTCSRVAALSVFSETTQAAMRSDMRKPRE